MMKPTQEIIDELRKEAAHPPCPRRVSDLLTEAADRIDHLFASGIHTCHADCQRPTCVLRRELDKALAALEAIADGEDAPDIDAVGEWAFGLHCGLEDRMIADRYEAADYGHAIGAKKVTEWATGVARAALAHAESATLDHIRDAAKMVSPARHPDTVIVDFLDGLRANDDIGDTPTLRFIWGEETSHLDLRGAVYAAIAGSAAPTPSASREAAR